MNAREAAAHTLYEVIYQQKSLNLLLPQQKATVPTADKALYQALVYGTLREYQALSALRETLLQKPLKADEPMVGIILNLGIYQLLRLSLGDHGVLNETVELCRHLKLPAARGLVNAILRRVQRERHHCEKQLNRLVKCNLPPWILSAYKTQATELAKAQSMHPPMTLRIRTPQTPTEWLAQSQLPDAIINPLHPQAVTLQKPCSVEALYGFQEGQISVQDAAAQWAATLLAPQPQERLLDACAAPGGKTGHLLELAPTANLIALDHAADRLEKVTENLQRLQLSAQLQAVDAAKINQWWDGKPFDAILLDAPCSGSGVIRRHPDIPWLRTPADLQQLPKVQFQLLEQLWKTLAQGGRLLYTTCSILPRENQQLIEHFLLTHRDARLKPIAIPNSIDTRFGLMHFPDEFGDGFFYAMLEKVT